MFQTHLQNCPQDYHPEVEFTMYLSAIILGFFLKRDVEWYTFERSIRSTNEQDGTLTAMRQLRLVSCNNPTGCNMSFLICQTIYH